MSIRKNFSLVLFLFVSFAGSYALFMFYTPKSLMEVSRIKGYSTQRQQVIPLPPGSREIGEDKSSEGKRITFQTTKSPEEVNTFYINVFTVRGWTTTSKVQLEGSKTITFTKGNQVTVISTSTSKNLNDTVVVIDEKTD